MPDGCRTLAPGAISWVRARSGSRSLATLLGAGQQEFLTVRPRGHCSRNVNANRHQRAAVRKSSAHDESFGRRPIIAELLASAGDCGTRVLLTGPSGIGKSAVVRALSGALRSGKPELVTVVHEIRTPVMALDALLGSCAIQLAEQIHLRGLGGQGSRASIIGALRDHPFAIASAALLDVASHLLPASQKAAEAAIAALTDELAAGRADTMARHLTEAASRDLLGGMFALLEVLSSDGVTGTLIFDGLEQGSIPTQSAVSALLRCAPVGWTVIAALNDESDAGIATFNFMWPELAAAAVRQVKLNAIDLSALDSWTRSVRGAVPPRDVLDRVLRHCGGRPLYLVDWVEERSDDAETQSVTGRLGPYYEARLHQLPEKARRLVRQLSLLPVGWTVTLDTCAALLGAPGSEALSVIDDLCAGHFFEPVDQQAGTYRFVHEVAHTRVRESLPASVAAEAADGLLVALARCSGGTISDRYTRIRLSAVANHDEVLLDEGVATARDLAEAGSVRPAEELYRLTLAVAEPAGEVTQQAEARLGIARVFLDTGFYEDSLRALDTVDENVLSRPGELLLVRGQVLIRMNAYEDARMALSEAAARFSVDQDRFGELSARREENTILRDLERYSEAVVHARSLVASAEDVPPLLQAACHRSLSRSLALAGHPDEGIEHARSARALAERVGSMRAVGNARLSAAECLRHRGDLDAAIAEYDEAIKIAEALANRDSLLWAQLGLADAWVLLGRQDKASAVLVEVGDVVRDGARRYPLEFCHWRLSCGVIAFVEAEMAAETLRQIPALYRRFGIRWPSVYVEAVIDLGRLPGPKPI